jgi:uncharacterized integral membrane protein
MRTPTETSAPPVAPGITVSSSSDASTDSPVLSSGSKPLEPIKEPRSTRASRTWNSIVPALALLGVILLFVFQNLHTARVRFVTVSGSLPIGVALLAAAAFGGLFVLALGSVRMVQLRRIIRRNRRAGTNTTPGAPQ